MSQLKTKPTEAELEILQLLWQHGASSVRTINDYLNEVRKVGYTTTLKTMQIMTDKDLVKRDTSARIHLYEANIEEADTQQNLLQKFVDQTFRGSTSKLILQALGNHKASQKELDEIKALIERIEKEK